MAASGSSLWWWAHGLIGGVLLAGCAAPPVTSVSFGLGSDRIAVRLAGAPFCEYRWDGARPVIWPILATGGIAVTRAFPFAQVAGEAQDHPHHQGLWFAHGDVNGVDFWQGKGRIVPHTAPVADPSTGRIADRCRWLGPDGREIAQDERTFAFAAGPGHRTIDVDLTLIASQGELRLGDTKEGTFALRVASELAMKGPRAAGSMFDSEGRQGAAVWGQRARFVVYHGTVAGRALAVAIFDHPDNPAAPTHWHARDYGLFAANPFGVHDFRGAPAGAGERRLRPGERLRFRYRVLVHDGVLAPAGAQACWQQWVAESP